MKTPSIKICCQICGEILTLRNKTLFCSLLHGVAVPVSRNDAARFHVAVKKHLGTFKPSSGRPQTIIVELNGERKSILEWAKDFRCTVKETTLRQRLRNGLWTPAEAILLPTFERGKRLGK